MLRISVFWLSHILFGMLLRHALNCSHLHRFDGESFSVLTWRGFGCLDGALNAP